MHLDDLLLRRTMLAKLGQLTKPGIVEIAWVIGNETVLVKHANRRRDLAYLRSAGLSAWNKI